MKAGRSRPVNSSPSRTLPKFVFMSLQSALILRRKIVSTTQQRSRNHKKKRLRHLQPVRPSVSENQSGLRAMTAIHVPGWIAVIRRVSVWVHSKPTALCAMTTIPAPPESDVHPVYAAVAPRGLWDRLAVIPARPRERARALSVPRHHWLPVLSATTTMPVPPERHVPLERAVVARQPTKRGSVTITSVARATTCAPKAFAREPSARIPTEIPVLKTTAVVAPL